MSGQVAPQEHPGRAIQERRQALGLSREGLAYKAGVSVKTVERLEREEGKPQRSTLRVIEAVLSEPEPVEAA